MHPRHGGLAPAEAAPSPSSTDSHDKSYKVTAAAIQARASANSSALLIAYAPVMALLLLFGGKPMLFATCFGGMVAYVFDLMQSIEGSVIALLFTFLIQWVTLVWASSLLLDESMWNFSIILVIGVFIIHLGFYAFAQFNSFWLELLDGSAVYVERFMYITTPLVCSTLLTWCVVVEATVNLPLSFAIIYFCYAYFVCDPRRQTLPAIKVASESEIPYILTKYDALTVYGVLVIVPPILHAVTYASVLFRNWSNISAFLTAISIPVLLCTFLIERHLDYWHENEKPKVLKDTSNLRMGAAVASAVFVQSQGVFSQLKSLSKLPEPWVSIAFAVVLSAALMIFWITRSQGTFRLGFSAQLIVRVGMMSVCWLGSVLLHLPWHMQLIAMVGSGAVGEFYMSGDFGALAIGASLASTVMMWYTRMRLWYIDYWFQWLVPVSMRVFCALLVVLIFFGVLLPGMLRGEVYSPTIFGICACSFVLLLAAVELIVRKHQVSDRGHEDTIYPDSFVLGTSAAFMLAIMHIKRLGLINTSTLWLCSCVCLCKALSLSGISSRNILEFFFLLITFTAPLITKPQSARAFEEGFRLNTKMSVCMGIFHALTMLAATFSTCMSLLPLLLETYTLHAPSVIQTMGLGLALWSAGCLAMLISCFRDSSFTARKFLVLLMVCGGTLSLVTNVPLEMHFDAGFVLVRSKGVHGRQRFDVLLALCVLLLLVGLDFLPVARSGTARLRFSVLFSVLTGVYLDGLFFDKPSVLCMFYCFTSTLTSTSIVLHSMYPDTTSPTSVRTAFYILFASPAIVFVAGRVLGIVRLSPASLVVDCNSPHPFIPSDPYLFTVSLIGLSASAIGVLAIFALANGVAAVGLRVVSCAASKPGTQHKTSMDPPVWSQSRGIGSVGAILSFSVAVFACHRGIADRWKVDIFTPVIAVVGLLVDELVISGALGVTSRGSIRDRKWFRPNWRVYVVFCTIALSLSALDSLGVWSFAWKAEDVHTDAIADVLKRVGAASDSTSHLSDEALAPWLHIGLLLITYPSLLLFVLQIRRHTNLGDLFIGAMLFMNVFSVILSHIMSVRVLAVVSLLAGLGDAHFAYQRKVHASKVI